MYYILFTKTSHTKIRHLMDHSSGIPVWTISVIPEGSEGEITSVSLSFYHILYTLFIFIISEGDGIARVSAIKRQP